MHKPNRAFLSITFCSILVLFASAFAFGQSGAIKGKVRTFRGDPIASVEITARRDGSDVKTVRSGSKGEFAINGLDPGIYNVVFDAPGYNTAIRYSIEVRSNKTVDLGDKLILSVDKGSIVIVQGSVFYKDGRSITGARVLVEKVNEDGTTSEITNLYTSVSGEFTFRRQPGPAKFKITARYKGAKASKEIEVDDAAIYRLAITLDVEK
jgi:hypothetical protein